MCSWHDMPVKIDRRRQLRMAQVVHDDAHRHLLREHQEGGAVAEVVKPLAREPGAVED